MNDDEPTEQTPVDEVPPAELATLGQRIGARLIDWLIIFGAWAVIMCPMSITKCHSFHNSIWARLASLLVLLVYETGLVAWRGQTVGKMLLGIRLTDIGTGSDPPFVKALLRAAIVGGVVIVTGQFFAVALVLLYFTAAFTKDTRGLLDRAAGTVVVKG